MGGGEGGAAKFVIQIKSDWLLICFTFLTKSPGKGVLKKGVDKNF